MNTSSRVIAGFVVGAAVGAAIGVLLAPYSGSETRKKMKDESKRLADQFADTLTRTLESVRSTYNEKLDQYAEDGKHGIDSMKEKIRMKDRNQERQVNV